MESHNFRTGLLKKKDFHNKDLWKLVHALTPAQASFFREACAQLLGVPPSKFWGNQKIWFDLPGTNREALIYLLEALNHAPHITSMKLSKHKKAGLALGSMAKSAARGAAKAGKYIAKGVKVASKIYDVAKKVSTGIEVAKDFGIIGSDSDLAQANDMFQMVSGMAGSGFRPEPQGLRRK